MSLDFWRDIVGRKKAPGGAMVRELSCGHFQGEISGGRSSTAVRARCLECLGAQPAEPVALANGATCTALVTPLNERRMRVCGAPAVAMKKERPRCARHARKVIR